jgi:hypothetical protein
MKRPSLSTRRRLAIWQRDRFTCTYCGASALTDETVILEVDHKIAVADGGTSETENLTTACRPCNLKKGPGRRHTQRQIRPPARQRVRPILRPPTALDRQLIGYVVTACEGWSDTDIAAMLGCTRAHWSNLRKGDRQMSYVMAKRAARQFPAIVDIVMRDLMNAEQVPA